MQNAVCFISTSFSLSIQALIEHGYTVFDSKLYSFYKKVIRKIARTFKLYWKIFFRILWGGINLKSLESFQIIIIFDFAMEEYFYGLLSKYFPSKTLIIYYMDTIRGDIYRERNIKKYKYSNVNIFSFDEQDCIFFNLKHNPYFFTGQYLTDTLSYPDPLNKVFFIGYAKDRKEKIEKIKIELDKLGINNNIIIIDTKQKNYSNSIIPYTDTLDIIKKSSILLDIVREEQAGATQRELEAVFLKKKLITNNTYINQRKYYNENNVFLIDFSKQNILENFIDFLNKPFIDINNDIKEYYSLENWLARFFDNIT